MSVVVEYPRIFAIRLSVGLLTPVFSAISSNVTRRFSWNSKSAIRSLRRYLITLHSSSIYLLIPGFSHKLLNESIKIIIGYFMSFLNINNEEVSHLQLVTAADSTYGGEFVENSPSEDSQAIENLTSTFDILLDILLGNQYVACL